MKKISLLSVVIALVIILTVPVSYAAEDCSKDYPNPVLDWYCSTDVTSCLDSGGRIQLKIRNHSAYNGLIRSAGSGACNGRTEVNIHDASTHSRISSFCALTAPSELQGIGFIPPSGATQGWVYVIFKDKVCNKEYKSNDRQWFRNRIPMFF